MNKSELRAAMRAQLRTLMADTERRRALSRAVAERVVHHPLWLSARCVLLFASLPDEVDTAPLLEAARAAGKQVLLPRVVGDDLELCVYSPEHLQRGAFGIWEPSAEAQVVTDYTRVDLALVPGLAFTPDGRRLGRGRGYYDRLLPHLSAPKYGVGYPCQVVPDLPTEAWDVRLAGVLI